MKKIAVLSIILLATIILTAFYANDKNYDKRWKKVESYQQKGLPKSALEIVDEIYNDAKKEQNKPQKIKALIYKASLSSTYEENYLLKSIDLFEKEIPAAESPEKQILFSLTAQLYQQYYSQNRYKILQRKQVAEPEKDPETWDAVKFNKIIESYYLKSLQPEDTLTKILLEQYKPVLVLDSINKNYYTTLYDLLASRAIDYFSSADYITTDFTTSSILPDTAFLLPAEKFINIDIPTDTHKNRVLKIYQHIIKSHIADVDPTALVTIDLARIEFIVNKWIVTMGEKGKIIPLLKNLYKKYKTYDVSLQIVQKLALQYKTLAGSYQPEVNSSQQYRYYYVKAVDLCKEAVALHPDAPFTNNIKNIITSLEQPAFSVETEKQLLPGEPFLAKVDFKNITKLYFKIVRVDSKEIFLNPQKNSREWAKSDKYIHNPGIRNQTVELPDTKDLQHHTTEIKMDNLPLGTYFIYASDSEDFTKSKILSTTLINVTNLSYITKGEDGGTAFLIQNRKTGTGMEGVSGDVFTINYRRGENRIEKSFSFVSDNNGFVKSANAGSFNSYNSIVRLIKSADTLYETGYINRFTGSVQKPTVKIYFFTDRSIYRPGQIIYFKGIAVKKEGDNFSVLKDYKTEVTLKDIHYKKVSSIKVSTNEYGSFSGSFVIPSGELNGTMSLQTPKGRVYFSVEEYKRPTFLVEFDTVTGSYKLNDSVTVTGKVNYFNGSPVSDANIAYRVTKQSFSPIPYYWFRPMEMRETEVTNGLTKVDENGNFSITFKALPFEGNQSTEFNISADVTDITGEVHSGKTSVKISNQELWVSLGMNEEIDKSLNPEIKLTAVNTAGKPLPVSGKLKIYRLQQPGSVFVERYWSEPDIWTMSQDEYRTSFPQFAYKGEDNKESWNKTEVLSKKLTWTGDTTLNTLIKNLKPSYYKFVFTALDKSGQKVADSITTLIFNSKDKKPVVKKPVWTHLSDNTAEPGETVNLVVASAEKNRRFYYELTVKNKIVDKRWIKLSKKQTVIPITIQESWRGGVRINLVSVKNNRRYVMVQRIKVPFTNKKLNIKLQTFRDHLTPGNKETWSVKITGFKGDKVAAELLAAMYDASLDQIKEHAWNFNLFHQTTYSNGWYAREFPSTTFYKIRNTRMKILTEYTLEHPQFNWFGMRFSGNNYILSIAGNANGVSEYRAQKSVMMVEDDVDMDIEGEEIVPISDQAVPPPDKPQQKELKEPIAIRSDFRETAFFYPQLHTDSSGSVVFDFTTPDALTQWKLMMLAHTGDLSSGIEELTFKAYKELMIMPNAPRFVRQKDRLMFSARVTNFSKKEQQIKVNLNFFDPVTNKKLNLFVTHKNNEKFLDLKAGESTKVSWLISIPDTINLMAYHIEATSGSYSDAEERVIPVLSNRVLVTETMPMYVNAHKSKKYRFTKLINQEKTASLSTLKNRSFTLEFTSNPAWYAIQALPYMSKPTYESASNLFTAYYSNALSGWIVNSNPKIKAVFDSWSKNSPDAFLSALQKNQELKNTVLEETPWVLEAENESEQKRRIALLFDLNNLKNQQHSTLYKLQQLQKGSGAWPWFNGMGDDRYTTQKIVLGMAKLLDKRVITLDKPAVKNMIKRAVSYLDRKLKEDYENLKKDPKVNLSEMHIGNMQIQYLYARVLLKDFFPLNNKYQKAYNYYLNQAQHYWIKKSNMLQTMIAVVMYETNNRNEAEAILRSLEERSLYSDEMGMYWRTNNSWYWYRAPVETQAMIIEAFSRMKYNPQNIYKMKIWLLKQKQTQHWKSTSATAEAVYALLMTGKSSLLTESKPVSITIANKPLEIADKSTLEAGTGYFKKTWPAAEVKPALGNIEVKNPNNNITWGAAYWQYFEDIDKVTASKSHLYVEKKLFVETLTNHGPVLEPIGDKELKTGDKLIVRLIIRADRDMEFIHLKDVHATGMEVVNQLSGYSYSDGLGYYRDNKDASVNFFIRYLNKGTYVIEYPVFLTQQGSFPVGLATIQSMYAPGFGNHSQGGKIEVGK